MSLENHSTNPSIRGKGETRGLGDQDGALCRRREGLRRLSTLRNGDGDAEEDREVMAERGGPPPGGLPEGQLQASWEEETEKKK